MLSNISLVFCTRAPCGLVLGFSDEGLSRKNTSGPLVTRVIGESNPALTKALSAVVSVVTDPELLNIVFLTI